jgi:predicted porin
VLVKFVLSDVRVNVGRVTTDLAAPTSGKSTLVGVNYSYYLSKRTNLYAGIGQVRNNVAAQFGLEGGSRPIPSNGRDSDTTAIGAGIRTTF